MPLFNEAVQFSVLAWTHIVFIDAKVKHSASGCAYWKRWLGQAYAECATTITPRTFGFPIGAVEGESCCADKAQKTAAQGNDFKNRFESFAILKPAACLISDADAYGAQYNVEEQGETNTE